MNGFFHSAYRFFPTEELTPRGWLRRQLEIQAEGLSGHLHEVWPDIRDSAWIGGHAEGWERVPYWLDGFLPLAYLLRDERLIQTARRYLEAIMDAQQADGWICPCKPEDRAHYDTWAVILICKVLMVYHSCSGDERAVTTALRAMENLFVHLQSHTLFNWGQSRWFEALLPLQWLYERHPEPWMEELAVTLYAQGFSWKALFEHWHDQEPDPHGVWRHPTHIVNLMMALKSEAVVSGMTGDDPDAFAEKMYAMLQAHHGTPIGHIQGDECLTGRSPVQGTELCAIVEQMYSCEILASITGKTHWLDLLEQLAFNSLPATISADMWSHQYVQMLNQIACTVQEEPPVFRTNGTESNLFGLEPNFGCCTANFSQGWPKLAQTAFLKSDRGILSAVLVPSRVETEIHGNAVAVTLDTDYPFRDTLHYAIHCEQTAVFEFSIRIPGFVQSAVVNGVPVQPGILWKQEKTWSDGETVEVRLKMQPAWISGFGGLRCLQRGPLFYALPIPEHKEKWEYIRSGVERKFPYCDYRISPTGEWRYGFAGEETEILENEISDLPFSREHPPVQIRTRMGRVAWETYSGQREVCAELPGDRMDLSPETHLLQPYGCTNLRMTLMPFVPAKEEPSGS